MKPLNSKGQSMAEFALLLPLLLLLILSTVEFVNLFVQSQRVASLTRELAYAAYFDCASYQNSSADCIATPTNPGCACASNTLQSAKASVGTALPNYNTQATAVLTTYQKAGSPTQVWWNSRVINPNSGHTPKYNAFYCYWQSCNDSMATTISSNDNYFVMVELFYNYTPITPVNNLLHLIGFPPVIYDSVWL